MARMKRSERTKFTKKVVFSFCLGEFTRNSSINNRKQDVNSEKRFIRLLFSSPDFENLLLKFRGHP